MISSACNDPGLIPILVAIRKMLSIIQIIGPIFCIIMLSVNITLLIKNPDDKKLVPKIRNTAVAMVMLFLVPVIVNAFFALLDNSTSFSSCWNSAVTNGTSGNSQYISPYGNTSSPTPIYESPGSYQKGK